MSAPTEGKREGSLEAPERHALDWKNPGFYDEQAVVAEMERIFDICHGCRRCFSLCNAFPTLFDAIDESETMELDGVDKRVYWDVVDQCYLCDMCFMSKCPYVPPHEWDVDFPHVMLRAKAVKFQKGEVKRRDRMLTSTDAVGRLASIPVVAGSVNAANRSGAARKLLDSALGVHPGALLPAYHSDTLRKRLRSHRADESKAEAAGETRGKVVLFTTCYGNYNEPDIGADLVAVFEHNSIPVTVPRQERCCGMPKLELGDLAAVEKLKDANVPELVRLIDAGWDIVAPVPSCVLMFKQELPLLFAGDADVEKVRDHIYDPFEYLMLRHKEGKLRTDFKSGLGRIAYHVACHLRVQNLGLKTRDLLQLVPETEVEPIERCSGHNGTYAVKSEFHEASMKIAKPVVRRVEKAEADYYSSDCPMAGHQIENGLTNPSVPVHPLTLLRRAYGI
ncbi:MAG TPA: heterodisulfide reductase-related iron-sulfur binding cluster [Gammaproteobacteria bacterium]|nr:heterodisulfide reductase-related iron-sulfur binding cluster [Gammaproteobacteria bacterium]